MDKVLKYRIVCWCVAIFLIIFLPQAVSAPSQVQTTAIVSGLGIDKSQKGVEVSAQIIIPEPSTSYSPKNIIVSAEGSNMLEAISNIELKVGQQVGLAHCYIIVLGDELCQENMIAELDYLMRSNIMGNNSALVHTSKKAKDLLKLSSQFSESDVNNLQNIAKYNKKNYNSSNTSLIELYNEYLSPSKCSLLGTIDTEEQSKGGGSESSGGGSGGNQGSQGEKQQSQKTNVEQSTGAENTNSSSVFKNDGSAIVIKDGKKLTSLSKEDIIKFNWLDAGTQTGVIEIKNYTDDELKNATILFKKLSKKLHFNPKIVNNIPVLEVNLDVETKIESIKNEEGDVYTSHKNYYNTSLLDALKSKIKSDIEDFVQILKEKNFDIWKIYSKFNIKNTKAWKAYLQTLDNPENYIQKLEIVANINITNQE